jgi:hypothetical protein
MKSIKLTQGYECLVDDEDYDYLSQWQWHVLVGNHVYAMRNSNYMSNGKRKHILMHRVVNKTPDNMYTDHINGNSLDNRKSNLRSVTHSENMLNRKPNKKSTSKYKGVCWHKQHRKWITNLQINKKRIFVGLYKNELDAAKAYVSKVKELGLYINEEKYYGKSN